MNANPAIQALIGLGNTGREYEHTYHNIGAWSLARLQEIARANGFERLLFKQPVGFMNDSGLALAPWLKIHNLSPAEVIIIHDDSDLPIGQYKLVKGGGSAGHKGLENVIENFGTEDFYRLRIGIRDPNELIRKKALEFVLYRFPKEQEVIFLDVLERAWQQITPLLRP